ncbi:4'-phosphopantetheinyl transferase superfamily protein [Streptomyces sp. B-S-A8]|uniref:4'-phosphopantetheinyl transferase superfamily protein n=1 Tax=Streptomyces solicavernae TaxID=3043614 RepID=A0ABT6RKZ4_9ACTN|nr:4'-phosphopantetheinyl transferase superfamily protein [Streptomyces sp. B-S-A8]MDI3385100.1 4'-phosphopantetheinyl transferase superfamily protein [Streptomyces sp. B-S-A8]
MSGPAPVAARRLNVPPGLRLGSADVELPGGELAGVELPGGELPGGELAGGELAGVELWLTGAPDPDGFRLLDAGERARAERLRRAADRQVYVAAHALLRRLLGARLDRDPAGLRFVREACPGCGAPHGRPALPGTPVHFSLSHSGQYALIGLADRPVGVDLEALAADALVDDVAASLHPREHAELSLLPPGPLRTAAFTRCWTRKEACLKGTGEGITGDGLHDTYVGTGPEPQPVTGWALADVAVPEGYVGAVSVRR